MQITTKSKKPVMAALKVICLALQILAVVGFKTPNHDAKNDPQEHCDSDWITE